MKLKILSYNIHKGFSPLNKQFSLRQISETLKSIKPDIIFLQEVIGENHKHSRMLTDWPKSSQEQYLSESLGFFSIYGKNAVYQNGHHGNAILSGFPIVEWEMVDISYNRWEKRGILYAKIRLNKDNTVEDVEKDIHLFCTHLNLFHGDRMRQYKVLQDLIYEKVGKSEPAILAGDFNDWNKKASPFFELDLSMLEGHKSLYGVYPRTFPSIFPVLSLDRVYLHNLRPIHCEVLKSKEFSKLSDHLPILLELEIKP